ncbi:hypothetical protein [Streptomyces sp. NPDC050560]|uniref:hypothetical protein n=1 Tax=Streptomyces sp. NPDC050560 TaxID=3365630 RepID=UPI0037A88008
MRRLLDFQRRFRIWHYSVSYSRLLLRSLNIHEYETRIDVLFTNVELMHVPSTWDTLVVDEQDRAGADSVIGPGVVLASRPNHHVFVLNGGPYYVFATHCDWHEDEGDSRSPSKFGPMWGIE